MFGVEVFVIDTIARNVCLSTLKQRTNSIYTWAIQEFSDITDGRYYDHFTGEGRSCEDRDRRSFHDAEDRPPKPPFAELTRGKGVASDYPRESQKRCLPTGPIDFQEPVGGRESTVHLGGSACGSSSSMTPASYAKERFKYEMIDGHRVELESNGNILPRDLRFAGPQAKICGLPHPDDGFICYEYNALALAQAMDNVSLVDQRAYHHETKSRMAEWMGRDLNWNLVQSLTIAGQLISVSQEAIADRDAAGKKVKAMEEDIVGLRSLHTELTSKYNEFEEGMAAISELARPATKAGYSMAFQHFGSYLSEVPADKKWDGLPWPHDDIGVTDQNVLYYIVDGPPLPVIVDAEEEGEPGEVIIADS
ncbi:hypothetical protein Dimus_037257 [Dionaea muscipula]